MAAETSGRGAVLICADREGTAQAETLAALINELTGGPVTLDPSNGSTLDLRAAAYGARPFDLLKWDLVVVISGDTPSARLRDTVEFLDRNSPDRLLVVSIARSSDTQPPMAAKPHDLQGWRGDRADARLSTLLDAVASQRAALSERSTEEPTESPIENPAEKDTEPTTTPDASALFGRPLDDGAETLLRWTLAVRWDSTPPGWPARLVLGALVALTQFGHPATGIPDELVRILPGGAPRRVDAALRALGGRRGDADALPYAFSWEILALTADTGQYLSPTVDAVATRIGATEIGARHLLAAALTAGALPTELTDALGVLTTNLRHALRRAVDNTLLEEPAAAWDELLGPLTVDWPRRGDVVQILSWIPDLLERRPDCPPGLAVLLATLSWLDASMDRMATAASGASEKTHVERLIDFVARRPSDVPNAVRSAYTAAGIEPPTQPVDASPLAAYLEPVLRTATMIAEQTGAGSDFDARHLLAAALVIERVPADLARALDGADEGELRIRLRDIAVQPDDDGATLRYDVELASWTELLLPRLDSRTATDRVPVRRRRPRREDEAVAPLIDGLEVDAYVAMLAAMIVRRSTAMPLSIGLFGEWGSGKSYFMELLRQRVEQLSRPSSIPGSPYVSTVVQISFNAWTYADTNLWASLAAEFFEQLGAPDVDPDDARREQIQKQLAEQNRLRGELADVLAAAEERKDNARDAYADAAVAREQASRRFGVELLTAVARQVASDPTVQESVSSVAATLGVDTASEQVVRFADDIGSLADDTLATRRLIVHNRLWVPMIVTILVLLGISLTAAFVLPGLAGRLLGAGTLASLATALGFGHTIVAGARRLLGEVRTVATAADRARIAVLDDDADLKALATDLRAAEARETSARARLTEIDGTVAQLEGQLAELRPGRKLYEFIAERAASTDYRGQLGVVSSVRRDFEHLVDLMERWRTRPDDDDVAKPIDRIVLYVDDLDRCEPDQVVQVLQAVHLLLAMDLFIVVVGVDPRWLIRALEQRYRGILDTDLGAELGFEATTPQNYLEKIFQIPFVLPPMSSGGFEKLITSLAAPGPATAPATPPPSGPSDRQPGGPVVDESAASEPGTGSPTAPMADLPPARTEPAVGLQTGSEAAGVQRATDRTTPDTLADIVSTPITRRELDLLRQLAPLVRTPRAATRLFNLYGIVRSANDLSRGEPFLGAPGRPGAYQAVAQLLGILTADPELLGILLWGRPEEVDLGLGLCRHVPQQTWFVLIKALRPTRAEDGGWSNAVSLSLPPAEVPRWNRLVTDVGALQDVTLTDLAAYRVWGPEICRFSFLLSPFVDREAPVRTSPAEPR